MDFIVPTSLLSKSLENYGLVYFPGAKSPTNLLKNPETVEIVKKMYQDGTYFVTICHSPLLQAEAGVLKNRKVTDHHSIKSEMESAGAVFENYPIVRAFDQILTGKTHFELGYFMPELMKIIRAL